MQNEPKIAAYEGGALHVLADESSTREVVLALPLTKLIVRMLRVPADQDDVALATDALKSLSPFPDEPLSVSCEIVRETAEGRVVLAAALPESAAEDVAEALDAAKLNVVRVDALALGALRCVWNDLDVAEGADAQRKLVILRSPDALTLIVLDGDLPVSIRAVADAEDLAREKTLSLLEAEDFNGPRELAATIEREVPIDAALAGIRDRASDPSSLNTIPESWQTFLEETRFKAKLVRNVATAGGLWLLVMAVLLGVPVGYGYLTDGVKDQCDAHAKQYREVSKMKAKTELVKKSSVRSRSALEMLKAVSDRLPEGITLSRWDFDIEKNVRVSGASATKDAVYDFKEAMQQLYAVDTRGNTNSVFQVVDMSNLRTTKEGWSFSVACGYEEEETR